MTKKENISISKVNENRNDIENTQYLLKKEK